MNSSYMYNYLIGEKCKALFETVTTKYTNHNVS